MYLKSAVILVTIFLCSADISFCQESGFGVTGNIGLSKIHSNIEVEDINDKPVLSSSFGFFFEKNIKSKFGFGAKLLWVSLNSETEENTELHTIDSETLMRQVVGSRTTLISFKSNYIGVPIYYFHTLNKLKIKTGIQSMLLLNTKSRFKNNIFFEGEASQSEGENSNFEFNKLDLGIMLGISYDLTNKLSLASSVYYGILNVDKESNNSGKRNRQITLGLNYYIHSF